MVKFIKEHNACPSCTKVLLISGILFFTITLNSQSLNLVDRIYGGVGHLSGLKINSKGQRFYLLKDLYDSLIINDNYFPLPPKDSNIGSPYFWGRDYLLSISDTSIFLRRPGGTAIVLGDSSLFVASSFTEDTLVTEDSVFINNSNGKSENLLIIQYDFNGNVLQSKHWSPQCTCLITINNLIIEGNEIFFCGEYSSINGIYLDQSILVPGYANGYFASMNNNLAVIDISPIQGMNEEYFIKMAKNTENNFLGCRIIHKLQNQFLQRHIDKSSSKFVGNNFFIFNFI